MSRATQRAYCERCGVIPHLTTRERVLIWIAKNEGADATLEDIADEIGTHKQSVCNALVKLRKEKLVYYELGPRIPTLGCRKRFRRWYFVQAQMASGM